MDLLLSWLVFPLVLLALCTGCGLAVEALAGLRLPGTLLAPLGLAAIVVVGQFFTLEEPTAAMTAPVVVILAAAGFALAALARRRLRPPRALVAALCAAFAVYAAPIVASGDATVAGYIKLDDTATWLAFTDQIMERGRELAGLAPSTFEATLAINVGDGYPVGAFVPLGIGAELVGDDPAWLIQPYMATLAATFVLATWSLAAPLVRSPWLRAGLVAIAVQPALLYGYYLWGGVKELAAVALIAGAAAFAAFALARPVEWRRLAPLCVSCAATIGVLSGGGAVWLVPILLIALVGLAGRVPTAALAGRAAGFAAGLGLLALPVILPGGLLPPTSSPLSADDAQGNLFAPLDVLQAAGIWPAGDFRLTPDVEPLAYALAALALGLALAGTLWAWRRRALGALCLIAGAAGGCLFLVAAGSTWVDGKALATVSPIVLFAALLGAHAVAANLRVWAGVVAATLLAVGVLWSNALAYRDVSLAPREQLAELEEIGAEIAGEGPTLMTEYSPYGARHFLREADPESVSELRRREIPRAAGEVVPKGESADTDMLDPDALSVYRTLVLRRSPARSRPPAAYELVWSGKYYEAWQRPASVPSVVRLALGSRLDPAAVPRCAEVHALARRAGELVAAPGSSPIAIPLSRAATPARWGVAGPDGALVPDGEGTITVEADLARGGEYEVWLGGSVRPVVELVVDGDSVGSVRHELNNTGQYVSFGSVALEAGPHRVELRFHGPGLAPGSGGRGVPVGPIALSDTDAAGSRLVRIPAAEARSLCGRAWDWIEAAR